MENKPVCEECGVELAQSQYAHGMKPDGTFPKANENLACRNYPNCSKSEVEPMAEIQ